MVVVVVVVAAAVAAAAAAVVVVVVVVVIVVVKCRIPLNNSTRSPVTLAAPLLTVFSAM